MVVVFIVVAVSPLKPSLMIGTTRDRITMEFVTYVKYSSAGGRFNTDSVRLFVMFIISAMLSL